MYKKQLRPDEEIIVEWSDHGDIFIPKDETIKPLITFHDEKDLKIQVTKREGNYWFFWNGRDDGKHQDRYKLIGWLPPEVIEALIL